MPSPSHLISSHYLEVEACCAHPPVPLRLEINVSDEAPVDVDEAVDGARSAALTHRGDVKPGGAAWKPNRRGAAAAAEFTWISHSLIT